MRANVGLPILLFALSLSGAASLLLETLWFEWLALHWGRTAEASAAVLASFMVGLGLGQWVMQSRTTLPIAQAKLWALCEAAVGLLALLANWRFANTTDVVGWPALLLMLPATVAMGMTLPLAVSCIRASSLSTRFGLAYSANTAGAAFGAFAAVWWLVPQLGLSQSGLIGVYAQFAAAILVWFFANTAATAPLIHPVAQPNKPAPNNGTFAPLLAVGVSGLFILGMEILWFRALVLTHRSTSENFAIMLATVLISIALGSLVGSLVSHYSTKRWPQIASRGSLSLLLGLQAITTVVAFLLWQPGGSTPVFIHCIALMLLPCVFSAMLMLLASKLIKGDNNRQAAAKLILASTVGSAIGAPLVALLLLPQFGVAVSLLCLLMLGAFAALINSPKPAAVSFTAVAIAALLLPGQWAAKQTRAAQLYLQLDQAHLITQADGKYQSVQLLESQFLGQALSHRLVTDSYSMTSTAADSERYMRFFAWLPQAMRGDLADNLLISYGLGTTAESILAHPATQSLTISDPSATVLETSKAIPRAKQPLADPRVKILLEDGRKVLQQSPNGFDLITGEPPPPRLAGMHALYSAEYFQLMHSALRDGGWASYWLPVDQLSAVSSKAIIHAFCSAFKDCSLWAGSHYNWILLGSRNGRSTADAIPKLWAGSAQALRVAGVESAAQIASAFIADRNTLQSWVSTQAPLTDNWPYRITTEWPTQADIQQYAAWMDDGATEQRFNASGFAETWPTTPQETSLAWALQPLLNGQFRPENTEARVRVVEQALALTHWEAPVLCALGTDHKRVALAQNADNDVAKLHRVVGLLAARDARAAEALTALAETFPLAAELARLAKTP